MMEVCVVGITTAKIRTGGKGAVSVPCKRTILHCKVMLGLFKRHWPAECSSTGSN